MDLLKHIACTQLCKIQTLEVKGPGFQWEHSEYIAGTGTLCPVFAQQEHSVHILNVISMCAPNMPVGNILFPAEMGPCHVSDMYPPRTFQMLSTHVCKVFSAFSSIFWVHLGCFSN